MGCQFGFASFEVGARRPSQSRRAAPGEARGIHQPPLFLCVPPLASPFSDPHCSFSPSSHSPRVTWGWGGGVRPFDGDAEIGGFAPGCRLLDAGARFKTCQPHRQVNHLKGCGPLNFSLPPTPACAMACLRVPPFLTPGLPPLALSGSSALAQCVAAAAATCGGISTSSVRSRWCLWPRVRFFGRLRGGSATHLTNARPLVFCQAASTPGAASLGLLRGYWSTAATEGFRPSQAAHDERCADPSLARSDSELASLFSPGASALAIARRLRLHILAAA